MAVIRSPFRYIPELSEVTRPKEELHFTHTSIVSYTFTQITRNSELISLFWSLGKLCGNITVHILKIIYHTMCIFEVHWKVHYSLQTLLFCGVFPYYKTPSEAVGRSAKIMSLINAHQTVLQQNRGKNLFSVDGESVQYLILLSFF